MQIYRNGPTTERLLHRAMEIGDAEAFYRLNTDPEVMRFTGEPMQESPSVARSAIEAYPDFETVGYGRWACILRESNALIGFCGLKFLTDLEEVDIGYRFFPEYWGQGIATEAAAACLEFGFTTIGLSRVIGLVIPENLASIRVLEKLGFEFEKEITLDDTVALQYATQRPE